VHDDFGMDPSDMTEDIDDELHENMYLIEIIGMMSWILFHMTIVVNLNTWGHYYIIIQDTIT
jgi:hypothetical protein